MKIATGFSTKSAGAEAIREAYQQLHTQLGHSPTIVALYASVTYSPQELLTTFQELAPNVPLAGSTSCLGVMTTQGFHSNLGTGLGLFGIYDPAGSYGIGAQAITGSAREAGAEAIQKAILNADRPGEPPQLVWLSGTPGYEEEVLLGIQDVIGSHVPIAGGSAADNTVSGHWQLFDGEQVFGSAVVVIAMYPSVATHWAFHSGYSLTERKGQVTKASGRVLAEIDGQPAAQVYNEWTHGTVADDLGGGNVLGKTTLNPLARLVGQVGDLPYYRLSHPDSITPEGAMTLFTNIEEGEEILLMSGTRQSLVTRAGRVAQTALDNGRVKASDISGALVVYCAGCMLTVQDRMNDVVRELNNTLPNVPYIGIFTFGEQGCFVGGENHHGNLMISVVVFEK